MSIILLAVAAAAAVLFRLFAPVQAMGELIPLIKIMNIGQYGYQGVLGDLAEYALPFVLLGLLLPVAFKKFNKLYRVCFVTLLFSLAIELGLSALGRPLITDAVIYAVLGAAVGFSIFSIISYFMRKSEFAAKHLPQLSKSTRISSIIFLVVVYFAIAFVMIADFGNGVGTLHVFKPEYPLPSGTTADFELPKDTGAKVYSSDLPDQLKHARELAAILNIKPMSENSTEEGIVLIEQGRWLTYTAAGEWKYYDEMAQFQAKGEVPSISECERIAREFFQKYKLTKMELDKLEDTQDNFPEIFSPPQSGGTPNPNLLVNDDDFTGDSSSEPDKTTEPDPTPEPTPGPEATPEPAAISRSLYFTVTLNGHALRGTGEVRVTIGGGGAVIKVEKFGPEFKEYTSVSIIPAKTALEKILTGEGTHTIFAQAASAKLTSCELGYMLEETQGSLLPVWLFKGTAVLKDGSPKDFEAYIPAIKE